MDVLSAGGLSGSSEPLMRCTATLECELVSWQRTASCVSQRTVQCDGGRSVQATRMILSTQCAPGSCAQDLYLLLQILEGRGAGSCVQVSPNEDALLLLTAQHLGWSLQGNLIRLLCIGERSNYIKLHTAHHHSSAHPLIPTVGHRKRA